MIERSQDSSVSVVTGVGARRRRTVAPFPVGQDIFIFPQTFGKRLGTTESPVQWVPGLLTRRVNWPRGEADHSSLSSVEVNLLKPNDIYIRRTVALTSRRYILNIYSTNIHTEYFKHAA